MQLTFYHQKLNNTTFFFFKVNHITFDKIQIFFVSEPEEKKNENHHEAQNSEEKIT